MLLENKKNSYRRQWVKDGQLKDIIHQTVLLDVERLHLIRLAGA